MAQKNGNMREEALAWYRAAALCDEDESYKDAVTNWLKFLSVVIESGDLLGKFPRIFLKSTIIQVKR